MNHFISELELLTPEPPRQFSFSIFCPFIHSFTHHIFVACPELTFQWGHR